MRMLIKGGRVVDPAGPSGKIDEIMDVLVETGRIAQIVPADAKTDFGSGSEFAGRIIDAAGLIVTPGLIDMHVHLREPGHEYKETIESGCLAAVHGGFTAICAMANTQPVNDSAQVTEYILNRARRAATARVYPVAAVSKGTRGQELCEYGELKAAGAVALSDDGISIANNQLMRKALEYAKGFGLTIVTHCEYLDLIAGGVMNEGPFATRLGLAGSPNAVESMMVMRDIALCELTGSPVHIAHISTREAVRAVREAKARGVKVTAETAPHYFSLTDEAVADYNTHAKMSPPLRAPVDRVAIREGLADGTIDAIASDHAPHTSIEKDVEFDRAAAGIIGLETSLGLSWQLVTEGLLSVAELVEKMSTNPARIFGLKSGLAEGHPADITLIDPEKIYTVDASAFKSLSRNTPFNGWNLKGGAVLTVVAGKVVFDELS